MNGFMVLYNRRLSGDRRSYRTSTTKNGTVTSFKNNKAPLKSELKVFKRLSDAVEYYTEVRKTIRFGNRRGSPRWRTIIVRVEGVYLSDSTFPYKDREYPMMLMNNVSVVRKITSHEFFNHQDYVINPNQESLSL